MTEPVDVKMKAQSSLFSIPNCSGNFLRLAQVYKLIDAAYKKGLLDSMNEMPHIVKIESRKKLTKET